MMFKLKSNLIYPRGPPEHVIFIQGKAILAVLIMIPLYDYSLNYNLYFSYLGSKIPQDDRNQIHSLNKYLIKTPWCK